MIKIKVERGATLEVKFFDNIYEAKQFIHKRSWMNELWQIKYYWKEI